MKKVRLFMGLWLALACGSVQGQKIKIWQAQIIHYDNSSMRGVLYDVTSQGLILIDTKAVAAKSRKKVQKSVMENQLPTFIVPFHEVRQVNIRRLGASNKGFGIGYLASFVTLETIMAVSILSKDKVGCGGDLRKPTLGYALVGGSCAAPPGLLVFGLLSIVGGGIGSIISSVPRKEVLLDPHHPDTDAIEKLGAYALVAQKR